MVSHKAELGEGRLIFDRDLSTGRRSCQGNICRKAWIIIDIGGLTSLPLGSGSEAADSRAVARILSATRQRFSLVFLWALLCGGTLLRAGAIPASVHGSRFVLLLIYGYYSVAEARCHQVNRCSQVDRWTYVTRSPQGTTCCGHFQYSVSFSHYASEKTDERNNKPSAVTDGI